MTREQDSLRAFEVLQKHCSDNMLLEFVNSWPREDLHNITNAMLAFADAEAAAMRERAAGVAEDRMPVVQCMSVEPIVSACKDIASAIRALPATGEVGCG